jgi:endonuclease/exonuclease/phosphatase (EEP) superfamily protein YafD
MPDSDATAEAPPARSNADPPRRSFRRFLWPDWQQRKQMLRVEAWAVVFAAYALLAFAYLWPQRYRNDEPYYVLASWGAILIRSLQFHLGLLLGLVALVAAFSRGRRLFVAAAPVALFTLAPALVQYLPKTPPNATGPTLRVMSVNLLMVNAHKDGIVAEIVAAKPDVVLMQEYTPEWHEALRRDVGEDYPYTSTIAQDDSFGIAIYSRVPFVGQVDDALHLGRGVTPQMRAVVHFAGRDVALYNIHLLPPRGLDYVSEHRLQFADVLDRLRSERMPYVLAGDCNFPDTCPQHKDLLAAGARESHEIAGQGRGATWPVNSVFRYLPGLRFDHVYLGPGLTAVRHEVGVGKGSDHRPVVVDVAIDNLARPP